MTMQYFGVRRDAAVYDAAERVSTPVGVPCAYCAERIAAGEDGFIIPTFQAFHRECFLRTVVGSVGHQRRRCSCHGGSEEDPPHLSRRQAARAAVALWEGAIGE